MNINDINVDELVDYIGGRNFAAFWWATKIFSDDFIDRKEYFFEFINLLLKSGNIKMTKHRIIIENNVNEILEEFKRAFPKTEEEMQDGLWFYFDECPWGLVWLPGDGSVFWTT